MRAVAIQRPVNAARSALAARSVPAALAHHAAAPPGACACGGSCPRCQSAGLQRKAMVSMPGDRLEREADAAADRVMRDAQPQAIQPAHPMLQLKCASCEDEEDPTVQRKASPGAADTVNPEAALQAVASGGAPLADDLRSYFEPRFGYDFSNVRVHRDGSAAAGARAVQARAYTIGDDIAFGSGEFAPGTAEGRRLIAHELTHVLQQRAARGTADAAIQRQPEPDPPPPVPGPTLMLAKPPHFPQSAPTCWASAIASWNRVKKLVGANVTDETLINHYRRTDCVDSNDMLIGDTNADVEAVFGEWRLLLDLSTDVSGVGWNFETVAKLLKNHGHFVVITKGEVMHAMVVYGVRQDDKNDPASFTVFVEDPLAEGNERAGFLFEPPIRLGLGMEKSSGPAPCRSRPPR